MVQLNLNYNHSLAGVSIAKGDFLKNDITMGLYNDKTAGLEQIKQGM